MIKGAEWVETPGWTVNVVNPTISRIKNSWLKIVVAVPTILIFWLVNNPWAVNPVPTVAIPETLS